MMALRSDGREYFRVQCQILLSCRNCFSSKPPRVPADSFFPNSERLDLLKDLRHIDHDHAHLLHSISDSDRNVSAYLGAINRKIDAVARLLVAQMESESAGEKQLVSLSEGGLSFGGIEALERGSIVALHLTLLPSYVGFSTYAEIIDCEPEAEGFRLSASFSGLSDRDRQLISRHVMQVQSTEQRKVKD